MKSRKRRKQRGGIGVTLLLLGIMLIGVAVILYPTFSDWWNSFHQTRAIAGYVETVANMDSEEYDRMWQEAEAYNTRLANKSNRWLLDDADLNEYNQILDVTGTGIMGYIEIPSINVSLPVYHGTDESVLQIAIGHVEGSSLPVGGIGTHSVLSGHRGLPSARLFTDIDRLQIGDTFVLQILDRTLTYEVDQVRIVLPHELQDLEINPEADQMTLVTCTPYGINTHRLLVRGKRIENVEEEANVVAEAMQLKPLIVAPLVAAPMLLLLAIWLLISTSSRFRPRESLRTDKDRKASLIDALARQRKDKNDG